MASQVVIWGTLICHAVPSTNKRPDSPAVMFWERAQLQCHTFLKPGVLGHLTPDAHQSAKAEGKNSWTATQTLEKQAMVCLVTYGATQHWFSKPWFSISCELGQCQSCHKAVCWAPSIEHTLLENAP